MKILVTGATGFLGGWVVKRLLDEGQSVRIIRRKNSSLEDLQGLQFEEAEGDVTNLESLVEATRGVDSVFHLAGLVAYTRRQREAMERVNVHGTANVVEACVKSNVRRLLHLSSVVAVGASFDGKKLLNEDSAYNLHHLNLGYFETKRAAEELVVTAAKSGRLDSVMVNPSTIYGAADAKKGSRGVQLAVARGKFPFYPSGGVNVVAVEDVIEATIQAWKKGRTGERYILAGDNLKIKELFTIIAEEAGVEPPSVYLPPAVLHAIGKVGDLMERFGKKGPINSENAWTSTLFHWFDSSKAQRELGFKARPSREAIAHSIQWARENGLLNK